MPRKLLHCYAEGREGAWEAICLDYDIAVQGESFEEVASSLREAVELYLESLDDLPPADRERLLQRRAPLSLRLKFLISTAREMLVGNRDDAEHHPFTIPIAA